MSRKMSLTEGGKMSVTTAKQVGAHSQVTHLLDEDHTPWYRKKNLRMLYFVLVPAALSADMVSGYDGSILNGLQAVDPWNTYFGNPQGAILGLLNAAFSIGALAVLPVVPFVNDTYGRKKCMILGAVIAIIGAILQTVSQNIGMFLASRLVLGFGIPFCISGASQLIAELAYPKERPIITGLFNVIWSGGSILAAGIVLGTYYWPNDWSWRLPSLFQGLPALLQLSFVWFVPESPRWLISKDRNEEALEILVKYHAEGDRNSAFVAAEFKQICETLKMEQEASQNPWREMLTDPANRKRLFIAAAVGLFSQWSGNGLISYYLAKILSSVGITDRKTQNQINLGLTSYNLILGVFTSFLAFILRRRQQYLIAFCSMFFIFCGLTAGSAVFASDSTNHSAGISVVVLIFLFNLAYGTMQPLHYVYMTELFPFISRSKGIALTQVLARGGGAFNLFVNPIGLQSLQWKYYLVFVVWLVVEICVIYFFYPETKGPSLEEVAFVLEGDNAKVGTVMTEDVMDEKHTATTYDLEKKISNE